jgi:hypothetical protein
MDLHKVIQSLYTEKERLDRVISSLEDLQGTVRVIPPTPESEKRRGRKSMSGKERQEVSDRMKRYWAARRQDPEQITS